MPMNNTHFPLWTVPVLIHLHTFLTVNPKLKLTTRDWHNYAERATINETHLSLRFHQITLFSSISNPQN